MREILFRGKRVDNGEWVYWDAFGRFATERGKGSRMVVRTDSSVSTYYLISQRFDLLDKNTIGQYTGLKDKNGKRIFEGDIIRADNGKKSSVSVVCYGEFSPRMFYDLLENFVMPRPKEKLVGLFLKSTKNCEEMFLTNCSKLIEVIGNIHDNPELMEG